MSQQNQSCSGPRLGERGPPKPASHLESQWLAAALDSIGDAVVAADSEGVVTFLNRMAESLTGWTASEAVGQPLEMVFKIVNEHTRRGAENPVTKTLQEGVVVGSANHTLLIAKDGTAKAINNCAAPLRASGGRAVGVVLVFRDASQQRRAEEALRESEERFRTLADTAPVLIWMSGPDKEGIYFNQTWLAFTGKPAEEQLGEGWLELVHPEDRQPLYDICMQGFRNREPFTTEFRLRRADGQYRWLLDTGTPRFNSNGAFMGFIGSCVDITDRKQAEEAMRDSEQRLWMALEAGRMGTWEWKIQTNEVVWSPSLEAIHGLAPGTFGGTYAAYEKDVHPGDREKVRNPIVRTLEEGGEHHIEYRIVRPDGSVRWVEGRGKLFRDDAGEPARMIGVCTDITDRKRVDDALRESEERFARFMQHLPGLAWIKDLEGRYVYANDAAATAFQVSREALYGMSDEEVFPPEVAAAFKENDRRALASKTGVQVVETLEHEDGVVHHSIVSKFPIPGPGGRTILVGGVAFDITDRKQAETALKAKEAELNLVAETTPLILARCSRDLRYLFANRAAAALFGLTPDEMVGRPIIDIMGEEVFAIIKPRIDQVLRGEPVEYEAQVPYQAVGPRWMRVNYIPDRDENGEVQGWIASIVDSTERKQAEADLHASEERFRALVSAITDVPWTTDARGAFVAPQPAWAAYTGQSWEAHRGFGWVDALHPDDREQIQRIWERACETRTLYESRGRLWHARSQQYRYFVARATPLLDADGKVREWVGTCTDVHEQRIAEDALKDADRRKDEFLAMLAHELRNPLAPIRSGLDILAMEDDGNRETIGLMQEQVQHLVRLVDDLLDVSRIMRGRIELRREPVELSALIHRSVEAVRPLIDGRQQELVVVLPKQPIWLNADPIRLVQIIENLLQNAFKYTVEGGRIELIAEGRDSQAVISVRDTGIGIEPELLPRVFEPFMQSSRSLDRAQGGLGIGLTLVQRLVEMHDGTIAAHSEGPGQGSTFILRLPVADVASPTKQAVQQPHLSRGRRILVVDDQVGAAKLLGMLLQKLGHHDIDTAHDGPSALMKIKALHPEIVLLDIGLPGMDGYQVARTIREMPEFDDVLLVALTGYGQEEDRQRSKQAGFDRHLVKPVETSELKELLAKLQRTACERP